MKVPSSKPYFCNEDIECILKDIRTILNSGILTNASYVIQLENQFAKYVGVKHAVAVNSGTAALEIALRYFDVKDREVLLPTNTFIASANAVIFAGGKPVLCDIDETNLCIDLDDLKRRTTRETKGVIVVHLSGFVYPKITELRNFCFDNKLFLLEDAAHAHGATIDNNKAGSLGDAGAFSFFPTKVMTTGEGGMITTNDDELAEYARSLRHHGVEKGSNLLVRLGYNWRMSELTAVLGIYQLKRLDENIKKRNSIAQQYVRGIANMRYVSTFNVPQRFRHSYYKFPALLAEGIDRVKLVKTLKENHNVSIGTIYYPPCHLQPVYHSLFGYKQGMLPISESILNRVIALPMYVELESENISYVLKCLRSGIREML